MTDARLTDVRWMDPQIAAKLDEAGVTVASLASMTPEELLAEHPYVGTINAWLLTSEAAWLMNRLRAGLWSPAERQLTDPEVMRLLEELEAEQTAARISKPEMDWPPPMPLESGAAQKSVRIIRIERHQEEEA